MNLYQDAKHQYTLPSFFFFNDTATTEIYTLSLHDALPIFQDVRVTGVEHQSGVRVVLEDLSRDVARLFRFPGVAGGVRERVVTDDLVAELERGAHHFRADRLFGIETALADRIAARLQSGVRLIDGFRGKVVEPLGAQSGQQLHRQRAGERYVVCFIEEHRPVVPGQFRDRGQRRLRGVERVVQRGGAIIGLRDLGYGETARGALIVTDEALIPAQVLAEDELKRAILVADIGIAHELVLCQQVGMPVGLAHDRIRFPDGVHLPGLPLRGRLRMNRRARTGQPRAAEDDQDPVGTHGTLR